MPVESDTLIIGCGIAEAAAALQLAQDAQRQITLITREHDPVSGEFQFQAAIGS